MNLKIQTVKVASLMWVLAVALGPVILDDVSRVQQEAQQIASASSIDLHKELPIEAPVKVKAGRMPASQETKTH